MRKKDKAEQKNTIDNLPRRNFLRGMAGFAGVGVVAMMSGIGCASISAPTPVQKEPEPDIDPDNLENVPYEEKFGIKIYGYNAEERKQIKLSLEYMQELPSDLKKMGIEYNEPINKLEAFKATGIPIIIDKNLTKNGGGGASFMYTPEGNKAMAIDTLTIRTLYAHEIASELFHEMNHSEQDKHKVLLPDDKSKLTQKETVRQLTECEIIANSSQAEFDALSKINLSIYIPPGGKKLEEEKVKEIARGASLDIESKFPENPNIENSPLLKTNLLKDCAKLAVLNTIAEHGTKSVTNMEAQVSAYNIIRGNQENGHTSPHSLLSYYANRYCDKLNYEQKREETGEKEAVELKTNIDKIYSLDSRGSLIGKIPHPLCEENNIVFDKVLEEATTKTPKEQSVVSRFLDLKAQAYGN